MISDIQSMLNPSSGKQSNVSSNVTLGNAGTLAKLSSEIKLIENLSLIKFQGSETLNFQGKPVQLLHVSSLQQPFTLINTGTPISITDMSNAQLNKTSQFQASLTVPAETFSRLTPSSRPMESNPPSPQTKPIENLILASRVVNLTVVSTPTSTNIAPSSQTINSQPSITQQPLSHPKENTQATNSPTTQTANTQVVNTPQNNTRKTDTPPTNNTLSKSQPVTVTVTVTDGKTEFPIISQTTLKKGDVIRVLVDANNILQALPPKANLSATTTPQLDALKQSLPKQLSFDDMSQLVKQLQTLNEASPSTLPPQTQQALKQLVQSLPNLATLTASPETMKQAIQTSGLFSESLLLNNNKMQLPVDLKLNLERLKDIQENTGVLRLGNAAGNNIPTEQIANAIERITTNQLRHMTDPIQIGTPNYPLHIELPIKDGQTHHLTQIEINQDSSTKDDPKRDRRWLVKLKFDFEETGRFDARASIQANKIGIIFAAEDPDTVQKLQKNLPALKQQLKDKDIDVERLDTFQSILDREEKNDLIKTQSLIDVRT
ncbi:MAG: flagellar motor switch/type III secretory pathway protein FliN [Marinomonas primoryensis]|jgi:flagellar motor switch/type III secretory pathway protein FliN